MAFVAIAVLIGVYSHHLIGYLKYLVGGVMVLFGLEGILFPVLKSPKRFYMDYQFFLGHVDILLGIVMIISMSRFDDICIVWGTWTIVRESFDLYEVGHKALNKFPAVFSLILSVTEIVFSILLIIYATEHHAMTHIYLLIPEFIINGASPLLFEMYKKRRSR